LTARSDTDAPRRHAHSRASASAVESPRDRCDTDSLHARIMRKATLSPRFWLSGLVDIVTFTLSPPSRHPEGASSCESRGRRVLCSPIQPFSVLYEAPLRPRTPQRRRSAIQYHQRFAEFGPAGRLDRICVITAGARDGICHVLHRFDIKSVCPTATLGARLR